MLTYLKDESLTETELLAYLYDFGVTLPLIIAITALKHKNIHCALIIYKLIITYIYKCVTNVNICNALIEQFNTMLIKSNIEHYTKLSTT